MARQRSLFSEPKAQRSERGSVREAALLMLLDEHEGNRGMVMIGTGKDIASDVARKLESAGLAIRDAGEPGKWLRLAPAGVVVAKDLRIREMPKGV